MPIDPRHPEKLVKALCKKIAGKLGADRARALESAATKEARDYGKVLAEKVDLGALPEERAEKEVREFERDLSETDSAAARIESGATQPATPAMKAVVELPEAIAERTRKIRRLAKR